MSARDVPDVVEEYESRKRTSNATDAVVPTHDLTSRDTREMPNDDDLPR